jgi:hypothetical protein
MEDTNNFEYVNVKARVPKVIDIVIPGAQGLPGEQGTRGPKGDPFRYEDFTPEQLEALKGPKGDKGDPFTYADFTAEQLEALKGPKGDKGDDGTSATADNAHQLLLQGNVWCESANVDDVLTAMIGNIGKPFPRTEFKPLTTPSVIQGQQVVVVTGEPHYSVKVLGNDTPFTLDSTGACTVTIPPLGEDDIKLTYHNFTGAKVADYTIKGVSNEHADAEYTENGVVYKLYGDVLKINVTNNTVIGTFNDNPKNWNVKSKVMYANSPTTLQLGNIPKNYGPYMVTTPENITFVGRNSDMRITIGTPTAAIETITFNYSNVTWGAHNNRYSNGGDINDNL